MYIVDVCICKYKYKIYDNYNWCDCYLYNIEFCYDMRIYDKYNNVFVVFAEGDISELSTLCPTECKYHNSMFV